MCIRDSNYGIYLGHSSNNIIKNNRISNNSVGIDLDLSSNNQISDNTFIKDGILVFGYKNIIERNTVNGRPLVYLEEKTNVEIEDAGQVILVNCSNIEVKNLNLSNTDVGIELLNSENCKIGSNVMSNNGFSILLVNSSNNTVKNNSISNNEWGVLFLLSSSNTITNNRISNNEWGIGLHGSLNNIIKNNEVSDNGYGIRLIGSDGNTISGCNILNNYWGIFLYSSYRNKINHNNFINNSVQATFKYGTIPPSFSNCWYRNYWSDWRCILPRPIHGEVYMKLIESTISWFNFDILPSMRPH